MESVVIERLNQYWFEKLVLFRWTTVNSRRSVIGFFFQIRMICVGDQEWSESDYVSILNILNKLHMNWVAL